MFQPAVDTPFTFKGYVSNEWVMELQVLHTEVDPDPSGVLVVKNNPSQLQVRGITLLNYLYADLHRQKKKKKNEGLMGRMVKNVLSLFT